MRYRSDEPEEAVGPLMRGIAVLRALTNAGLPCTPPELAGRAGLARASLDRILATLAELDFVRVEGRQVSLAPPVMRLGNAYLHALGIPTLLGPLAERLSNELDEIVTLTVADDEGVHVVHESVRPRRLVIACHVGDRLPLDRCAAGAVFASTWDAMRWERFRAGHECASGDPGCADELSGQADQAHQGWALDDQWLEPGLVAVAVPVHGRDGTLACTVNVLSFTSRHATAGDLADTVLPATLDTARHMAKVLREAPPPETAAVVIPATGPHVVESLARGLRVLGAFGEQLPEPTIADLARATALPRATVRRALITLEHLGYVAQDGPRYRPTAAVLSVGYQALTRLTLAEIASPHLDRLAARLGESVSLAVPHGEEIICVAGVTSADRLTTVDIRVGARLPAGGTAMGRVLSAGVDEFALADDELESGLRSIAVPVHGRDSQVMAALGVATHGQRGSVRECVPALRVAADALHRDLVALGAFHRLLVM